MAENFNLVFGSQAPTTASWSDADYQTGWNVVGSTPPTAEQFDALQNRSDKKAQELNNRMLPLEQKAEEQGRQAGTAYTVGAAVTVDGLPADWLLVCTTAGTSGTVAITLPDTLIDGATITDGTITWTLRKIATNGSLGYRQPSTAYTAGQIAYHSALPTGWYLECTTAGTSGSGALSISSPSIGGTVSDGTVTWMMMPALNAVGQNRYKDFELININDDSFFGIYGGNGGVNGGALKLFGEAHLNHPGESQLIASDNTNGIHEAHLTIKPDGTMLFYPTYGQNNVNWDVAGSAIVAKSLGANGYIKYASGLIMQWGLVQINNNGTVSFPLSFTTGNYTVSAIANTSTPTALAIADIGFSSCTILAGGNVKVHWLAIGY